MGEAGWVTSCVARGRVRRPPFTIQRLCELLLQPHQHHKTKRKLLYALDKVR